jgi:hypothetical protein
MDLVYLPVSFGEAIDKLTILDIKLDNIKDQRRIDVKKEYDILHDKLKDFLLKYNDLYQTMKKVNLLIWNMMDVLRDGNASEEEYLKVCKECIEYNDIRFRVKNKINYLSASSLKEQKSYKVNRLLIEISNEIVEIDDFIRPIKYYSFFYDELVICHREDSKLKRIFDYDPTIIFSYTNIVIDFKRKITVSSYTSSQNINSDLGKSLILELSEDAINTIL